MNKLRFCLVTVVFISTVLFPPKPSFAAMEEEINHLLGYINNSGCIFIRNGNQHDSKKTVKHIKKKYNYLKERIKNAEDFIKGAATGSSISGKPYRVTCNGIEMESAEWLHAELKRYRLQ